MKKASCENCKWYRGESGKEARRRTEMAGYFEFTSASFVGRQRIVTGVCVKTNSFPKVCYDDFCGDFLRKKTTSPYKMKINNK